MMSSPEITMSGNSCGEYKTHKFEESAYNAYTSVPLYKVMNPMLICMKIVGLYHSRDYKWPNNVKQNKCGVSATQIYSSFMLLVYSVNGLRLLYTFSEPMSFGPKLFFKIFILSFFFIDILISVIYFRACHNFHCFPQFFLKWGELHKDDTHNFKKYKKYVNIITMLTCSVVLFNMGVSVYALYFSDAISFYFTPLTRSSPYYTEISPLFMILHFYVTACWMLSIGIHFFICLVLYSEFKDFNKTLSCEIHSVKNAVGGISSEFEELRKRHHAICQLVSRADSILAPYIAFIISLCTVTICSILYYVIWYEEIQTDAMLLCIFMFWMAGVFVNLVTVSVGSALVNSEAHAAADHIYEINAENLSVNNSVQINLFVSHLNGNRIGLSAMKLFVVDKTVILTITGLLITYIVVMMQFSPMFMSGSGCSTGMCNCTELLVNSTL